MFQQSETNCAASGAMFCWATSVQFVGQERSKMRPSWESWSALSVSVVENKFLILPTVPNTLNVSPKVETVSASFWTKVVSNSDNINGKDASQLIVRAKTIAKHSKHNDT
ncbi:hypothetical protein OCU04_006725 [Sclerotinia nivalis]|uniref:Uncharacterized protein n=1 Tax=Sclerotinia nivalis TaxID=352851 RepID=A0A9X0DJX8_9HELO|nr:hypothetical protein OCU04_006725 [Sclerotinia nivalis]